MKIRNLLDRKSYLWGRELKFIQMVCSKNIVTTTNELFCCQGIERSLILRFALIRIFVILLA